MAARKSPTTTRSPRAREAGETAPARKPGRVVTGVSYAFVNCLDGVARQYHEGDVIPETLVDADELDRLASLDVFGEHPRVEHRRHLERLAAMGLAHNLAPAERSEEELAADKSYDELDADDDVPDVSLPDPVIPPEAAAAAREAAMGSDSGAE